MARKPATSVRNIQLIGHSGCKLEIKESGGNFIVTKTSRDEEYNRRLIAQHEKQKAFTHGVFRAPAVLAQSHDASGLFNFSMEYIHGFTLAEYLKKADASSIHSIADKFLSLIPKKYGYDAGAKNIFANKLAELEPKIDLRGNEAVGKAFRQLQKYDWEYSVASECHGDLSLENIIWKDGDLYLIDFLDSFYDSWMIDFGKLLLDIECLWSYRHESKVDENLKTRLSIFKKMILDDLLRRENGEELVHDIYHMSLLHILRIIPYTDDDHTKEYLHRSVNKLHTIIESL